MSEPPPNPYVPGAAVAAEARESRPSRLLAVLASLLCSFPVTGAGLYVLGRPRRFVIWLLGGVLAFGLMVVAALAPWPRLFLASFAVMLVLLIATVVDSIVARAGRGPRLAVAIGVIIGIMVVSWGATRALRVWLQTFRIPSGNMIPALRVGDQIVVSNMARAVERGDVIVFTYPSDPQGSYIARVVGVGGDRMEIRRGVVFLNGEELAQATLSERCPDTEDWGSCTMYEEVAGPRRYRIMRDDGTMPSSEETEIPAGHLFVIGDNRDNSLDSRARGPVPVDLVKGKVLFVWWSRAPGGEVRWERLGAPVR